MVSVACLAIALVCLTLSGALWLGLENAVTEFVLSSASGHRMVVATFFLNVAALVGALFYLFVWRPEPERLWLWGVILGWSGLSITGVFAALGVDLSINSPFGAGTLKLSPSVTHTATSLVVSAVFVSYCMRQYERARVRSR
jgi:hypothetical protein